MIRACSYTGLVEVRQPTSTGQDAVAPRHQPQKIQSSKCGENLSTQDIAIIGILLSIWNKACVCQQSEEPIHLKRRRIVKMIRAKWSTCGVRLNAGIH